MASELTDKQIRFCPVQGFPNYIIYEDGSVWSKERIDANNHPVKGRFLKPTKNIRHGYSSVMLHEGNRCRRIYLHRLVAENLLPNPLNLLEVNHIDGNKGNNHLSNLEWVTSSENKLHAIRMQLTRTVTEKKTKALVQFNKSKRKLTETDVAEIKLLHSRGVSFASLGKQFGISASAAWLCYHGRTYKKEAA